MALHDLIRRIPMSRAELGANDAFLLDHEEAFYLVENGHVDLFAVMADDRRNALTRKPFIARIQAGRAFFGSPVTPSLADEAPGFFAFQAVPAPRTVLLRGEREPFVSPDTFDLDAVVLIDDWVMAAAEFVAMYEPPPPRDALRLEADPDVPYGARSALSAHHLEVLWVSADRPGLLVGRPEFPVRQGTLLPLTEHTWLTFPEAARVSAVHTPTAILGGRLWSAMDSYNLQVLRCARHYLKAGREASSNRDSQNERRTVRLRGAMLQELTSPLSGVRADGDTAHGHRGPLQAAAAIVADAAGVALVDAPAAGAGGVLQEVLDEVARARARVDTAGHRLRRQGPWQGKGRQRRGGGRLRCRGRR